LFDFLQRLRDVYPIYLLKLLSFVGEMAFAESQDTLLLELLRQT
jgi:hypothetical protein